MLHLTVIILLCCAVSAPIEGIAVIKRKNYISDGFCVFDQKIPKVKEVSSTSVHNVDGEEFFNCVKQKITHKPSFLNNFFINQYQNEKNNYCSMMDNFSEKRNKKIGSSVELTYRKRNLLWTQKGLQSLKKLNYKNETSTTTLKPIQEHNLNFKEKKKLLALKKTRTFKQKRVRRYTGRKQFVGKSKNLRENFSNEPIIQLSDVTDKVYFEKKMPPSRMHPCFHHLKKFINSKRNIVFHKNVHDQGSAAKETIYNNYMGPKFINCHSSFFNKPTQSDRSVSMKNLNKRKCLLRSNVYRTHDSLSPCIDGKFIQKHKPQRKWLKLNTFHTQPTTLSLAKNYMTSLNQPIQDLKFNENEKLNIKNYQEFVKSNEREDSKENQNLTIQEKKNYDNVIDRSESNRNAKKAVPEDLSNEKQCSTKLEIENFFKNLVKASTDYSNNLNIDFTSSGESNKFFVPKSTIQNFSPTHVKKKTPNLDFDFPDYDEIYDPAADFSLQDYPSHSHKRPKFKSRRKSLPKKRLWLIRRKLKSDSSHQIPVDLRRSLLLQKMERKKKCCCSKCSKSCETPHKCWKSAPLLCIPYIRKGQDDLLKYLIQIMQKMLTKPYPHKIDIFDNIKYKPCVKKICSNTCEDIMPHEPDDDEDDNDEEDGKCDCDKEKNTAQSCNVCTSYPPTPQPCPAACPPMPTPCPPSCPITPVSCPKNCSKISNNPVCPSFPCSLPNLNQIYTETTPCSSDKCFSTLPSFLFPPSSVFKSTATKIQSKISDKLEPASPSVTPTKSAVTLPSVQKNTLVSPSLLDDYTPMTFFPPKKISPEYFKKTKKINTNSFVRNNQLQSDQRLNDKMLPELVEYKEDLKSLNLTENTSELRSTLGPSTSNEPFLFELPEVYSDGKDNLDFSNTNLTNLFAAKDLSDVNVYKNPYYYTKNPDDFSPNKIKQKFRGKHSKERRRRKKLYYKHLPINKDVIFQSFSEKLPEIDDKPYTDKQLHSRQVVGKTNKYKRKKHLRRQKREHNRKAEDFLNYHGNLYDSNFNDENYEEQYLQQFNEETVNSDENNPSNDYEWTPLKFEMFSELAKMITGTEEYTEMSSFETISTSSEPNPTNLPIELSSVIADQLETNSVVASTEKSSISGLSKRLGTNKTTSSAETKECNSTSEPKEICSKDKTYSKSQSSSTSELQQPHNPREKKLLDVNTYLEEAEDDQIPTTLGIASIAKGPRKQMTKPSPKIYTKIYPDSVPVDSEKNDTTFATTTDAAPKHSVFFKTTPALVTPDIRLQLLAVCEGYLEVIKIMQSQNRSLEEDLDSDLSRYCENIISQSFTQQTDSSKSKKQETNLPTPKERETFQNNSKKVEHSIPESKSGNLKFEDSTRKKKTEISKQLKNEKFNSTKDEINEKNTTSGSQKKQNAKKNKRKKKEYQSGNQEAQIADDDFLKKGMTKEQIELLHLLKKRKRELLNWLFNSKEGQIQPDVEETEYFDDNDESLGDSLNFRNSSGTVRPRGAKSFRKTEKVTPDTTKDSVFPVYAKQYGYDKGGELRQVEVLWRKLNERTHKKEIFKNLSVLALVLASTSSPSIHTDKFVNVNGYVNEDLSEIRTKNENEVGFAAEEPQNVNNDSVVKDSGGATENISHSYGTVTYINKPDPSSIIGSVTNVTNKTITKHPNITQKIAGKVNTAKGVVQEYTIEFWNYAVYILPIMFSILFLFCCTCCAMHILKKKKKKKRKKKKNKKVESTDEESSTEETDSEPKKKRNNKSKKSKSTWIVWKKNNNKTDSENDETNPPEKKKSFLRFLKGKKNEKAEEASSAPYSALPESDEPKADTQSEAAERKELIALLEELKKIEMENVGEKKEQKSVQVQYMIQDYDESVFKRQEKLKGYPIYNKNFPFYEPLAEDYELYKNSELTKLLPCECDYYSKKHDYLRNGDFPTNEGRCERFFKFVRNARMSDPKNSKKKDFDKDRDFLFDKCKCGVTNEKENECDLKTRVCNKSTFNLPGRTPNDWIGEVEHFNRHIMKKKHVRLKDDGVLCRL